MNQELSTKSQKRCDRSHLKTTVYTPEPLLGHPLRLLREMWADLLASRELAWRLLLRNISAMYRQTMFGYLWAFLPPLVMSMTFLFLSSGGVVNPGDTGVLPVAAYYLVSTALWQFFVDGVSSPLRVVTGSIAMLIKINFPREALILAGMGEAIFNFLIRLLIIGGTLVYFQILPPWQAIFLFPLGALGMLMVGTTLGLLLTPIGMLYRDIAKVIPMLMQFLMLISPVIYAPAKEGIRGMMMTYNPFSPVLVATRDWLTTGTSEHATAFGIVVGASLVLLFIGWVMYRVALPHIIARLGG
jgi:lipopolysaccharide transport system permease protein